MRLIGMLDSPYVRRVAVSLKLMEIPFAHEPLSVFRDFEAFAAVNPVVKAPTLVSHEGIVMMDSSLILDYAERLAVPARRLTPVAPAEHARAARITGLALAACEKAVQLVYEFNLRPEERRHRPWIDRVQGQLLAACRLLDAEAGTADPWLLAPRPLQPDISAAVAWGFIRAMLPETVPADRHPRLSALSDCAEALPAFLSTPPT